MEAEALAARTATPVSAADAAKSRMHAFAARAALAGRHAFIQETDLAHASTRMRVRDLRARAAQARASAQIAPGEAERAAAAETASTEREKLHAMNRREEELVIEIEKLRRAAYEQRHVVEEAVRRRDALDEQHDAAEEAQQAIADLEGQAADLEVTMGNAPPAPTPEEESAAEAAVVEAEKLVADTALAAQNAIAARRSRERFAELTEKAELALGMHAHVDAAVKALLNEAPAELLASVSFPGLSMIGEAILLDGIDIDRLSGAEQMAFSVRIARRLNARSKLLVVDGLERLDPEQLRAFVGLATADGFQLLATRVTSGPLTVSPIAEDR
jgi:hypothetical protein